MLFQFFTLILHLLLDSTNVAKCFCYYNLSSIVSGAESKTYYLNISSHYTKNASVVIDLSKKAEDKIEY